MMFTHSCFVLVTGQILVSMGISYAQLGNTAPTGPGQKDVPYFLGQYDATKAAGSRLQVLMDGLQNQYAADPTVDLREQIREREEFVSKLANLRSDAQRLANPALLPSLDSFISDAQESTNNLKSDLNERVRVLESDRLALKGQIDKLQKEIDLNSKLTQTLADTIKSIQDDHRREGIASELDALVKTPSGDISGRSPTTALPDAKKEHQK